MPGRARPPLPARAPASPAAAPTAAAAHCRFPACPPQATNIVQWYPGHIAKAERSLREQLKAVDMVLEVRDGRCPMSTRHPAIPEWVGSKPRLLLINRKDMVPEADRAAWTDHFAARGHRVVWTCGNMGDGVARVAAQAAALGETLNARRAARGLRPRPVRAVVIGFPNVGKSALINRLLGRRVADSAPKPGVTRSLRWARIGGDIDLLDAPGIIPMSLRDQVAAQVGPGWPRALPCRSATAGAACPS